MKRAGLLGIALIAAFVTTGGSAWAGSALKLCVPKSEGSPALTPKHGKCKKGYTLASLGAEGKQGKEGKAGAEGRPGSEGKSGAEGKAGVEGKEGKEGSAGLTSEERETLKLLLPHMKYMASGIGTKPTVQFSGLNVQIVDGEGHTETTNGEGNLVIGYDELPGKGGQTGSHDLILGEDQAFTSYGGMVAGAGNAITAPFASVSGGDGNSARLADASVSGGFDNTASGLAASVSGGGGNTASGGAASVSGGSKNSAGGEFSSISGGFTDEAPGFASSVSGGAGNITKGEKSWAGGGAKNHAEGIASSIFGGFELMATESYEAIP